MHSTVHDEDRSSAIPTEPKSLPQVEVPANNVTDKEVEVLIEKREEMWLWVLRMKIGVQMVVVVAEVRTRSGGGVVVVAVGTTVAKLRLRENLAPPTCVLEPESSPCPSHLPMAEERPAKGQR